MERASRSPGRPERSPAEGGAKSKGDGAAANGPVIEPEEAVEVLEARQESHRYEVLVGRGAPTALERLASGRDRVALFICAPVLATRYGRQVRRTLKAFGNLGLVHVLPDGERGKTLRELERASTALLEAGATRRSLVVALGGGAVTDAAGFLAATFMRGVEWVAVPTTLLAMVDAAIGGKTAVNLPVAKNAVGAFHPPKAVLSDPAALATLPARELRSGFGEALKYAALRPALLRHAAALARSGEADARLVADCARVKIEVVERDPKEKGERKLLNLGHTFGHGVEAAGRFRRYKHGEAVAVGLAFAFRLARRLGRVGDAAVAAVEEAILEAGLPVRVPGAVARDARRLMGFDKKRTAGGLMWVLPRETAGDRPADAAGAPLDWTVEWDVAADPAAVDEAVREIGGAPPAAGRSPRRGVRS
jgi:3-dehydroquinate synthase